MGYLYLVILNTDSCTKRGLHIHFFAYLELLQTLRMAGFETAADPVEWSDRRNPPETGEWKQWEVVAVRQAP